MAKTAFLFLPCYTYLSILVHLLSSKQTVNGLDDNLYNIDVLPFVEAADVISVSCLALVEDKGFISRKANGYEWIFAFSFQS